MSTVEILRAAKARIDTPEKWWDGGNGANPGAVCAAQALRVGRSCDYRLAAEDALARAMGVGGWELIPVFNDSHTHAGVMAAFDRAIASELAREQEFTVTEELMVA